MSVKSKQRGSKKQLFISGVGNRLEKGQEFSEKTVPLHITVMGWFVGANQKKLDAGINIALQRTRPIEAVINGQENFGPDKDIPVMTVENGPTQPLQILHLGLLKAAYNSGAEILDLHYKSYSYRPHVTILDRDVSQIPKTFTIDHVALVEARQDAPLIVSEVFQIDG